VGVKLWTCDDDPVQAPHCATEQNCKGLLLIDTTMYVAECQAQTADELIWGRFDPPTSIYFCTHPFFVLSSELHQLKPATSVQPYHVWAVYIYFYFNSSSTSDISCFSIRAALVSAISRGQGMDLCLYQFTIFSSWEESLIKILSSPSFSLATSVC
jgi:hypothetical protein